MEARHQGTCAHPASLRSADTRPHSQSDRSRLARPALLPTSSFQRPFGRLVRCRRPRRLPSSRKPLPEAAPNGVMQPSPAFQACSRAAARPAFCCAGTVRPCWGAAGGTCSCTSTPPNPSARCCAPRSRCTRAARSSRPSAGCSRWRVAARGARAGPASPPRRPSTVTPRRAARTPDRAARRPRSHSFPLASRVALRSGHGEAVGHRDGRVARARRDGALASAAQVGVAHRAPAPPRRARRARARLARAAAQDGGLARAVDAARRRAPRARLAHSRADVARDATAVDGARAVAPGEPTAGPDGGPDRALGCAEPRPTPPRPPCRALARVAPSPRRLSPDPNPNQAAVFEAKLVAAAALAARHTQQRRATALARLLRRWAYRTCPATLAAVTWALLHQAVQQWRANGTALRAAALKYLALLQVPPPAPVPPPHPRPPHLPPPLSPYPHAAASRSASAAGARSGCCARGVTRRSRGEASVPCP